MVWDQEPWRADGTAFAEECCNSPPGSPRLRRCAYDAQAWRRADHGQHPTIHIRECDAVANLSQARIKRHLHAEWRIGNHRRAIATAAGVPRVHRAENFAVAKERDVSVVLADHERRPKVIGAWGAPYEREKTQRLIICDGGES